MNNWKSLLKEDAAEWLLADANPSVRYFALRWLLDKPESDPDVVSASQVIARSTAIQKLLKRQKLEGYWGSDARPHHGTRGYLSLPRNTPFNLRDGLKGANHATV